MMLVCFVLFRMLDDPLMHTATAEIIAEGRSRPEVQRDIRAKERAREMLSKRYRSSSLGEEELLQCLYALSDNNSYLLFNRCVCGMGWGAATVPALCPVSGIQGPF